MVKPRKKSSGKKHPVYFNSLQKALTKEQKFLKERNAELEKLYNAHHRRLAPVEREFWKKAGEASKKIDKARNRLWVRERKLEAKQERAWKKIQAPLMKRFNEEIKALKKKYGF